MNEEIVQVAIKIPKDMWEKIQEGYVPLGISKYLKNGTVLPEYGRLIDADALPTCGKFKLCGDYEDYYVYLPAVAIETIENAPTILEGTVKE